VYGWDTQRERALTHRSETIICFYSTSRIWAPNRSCVYYAHRATPSCSLSPDTSILYVHHHQRINVLTAGHRPSLWMVTQGVSVITHRAETIIASTVQPGANELQSAPYNSFTILIPWYFYIVSISLSVYLMSSLLGTVHFNGWKIHKENGP
jgi:hypothetical protein